MDLELCLNTLLPNNTAFIEYVIFKLGLGNSDQCEVYRVEALSQLESADITVP